MAVTVKVSSDASSKAQTFLSSLADLNTALTKTKKAGEALSDKNEWDGASAQKFRDDLTQFEKHAQTMHTTLENMGKGAKTVISEIDSADSKGTSQIGGSTF